jgi:regulatory LuxR family protein
MASKREVPSIADSGVLIALNLSQATVKSHIANMMAMAGVHKRAGLITMAIAQGILRVQHPHQRTGRTCLSPRPPAGPRLRVLTPAIEEISP